MKIDHIHLESVTSTQDYLIDLVNAKAELPLTLVTTDFQSAGRGRQNNPWLFSSGNLAMSFTLDLKFEKYPSLLLGVVLADYFNLNLKWPNDLMTPDGRKCGGIIVQKIKKQIIAGVGVNFAPTGSFGFVERREIQKTAIEIYQKILTTEQENIIERFHERCLHMNQKVKLTQKNEAEILAEGIFRGLNDEGLALIERADGKLEAFASGSLSF